MVDSLWEGLQDKHVGCPMAITAENLAEKYDISKEDADAFALRSQQKWAAAQEAGLFKDEIVPIKIKDRKKGEIDFEVDEHPRPQTTIESLQKLKPLFKKGGSVSAGNASGISDGAGAVIVASAEAVKKHNLKPMARIVSYAVAGVPPEIMGIGPVPAIQEALRRANLSINDMDFLEINEAFASQFLACQKDLGFDLEKEGVQSKGGAIAQGHPTGASGSRIMGTLAYDLARNPGKKYAIGSACIGGGQGIAIILENCA
ncbi:3-ketoacyl-CoA thiolase, mitochondrial [Hondaea fermentalgiana]|uniref:3-ketoacyl-CoA thiolase, mitochondrial n=1 Tax=Hondaea fermentalgiana TaxID=2315210 RepID=A0A2R5GN28_9STRA|nr:3-ketoacyl-CoA thiolase, mitochondrial [Hondaea fermentalgiana]|eukprot:GBG29711.1 3-ketoacyl-CoA thiolase, mitochondrial [Hondaea fermentalgiana]